MSAITDKWLKAVPLYTDTLAGAISNATVTTFQVTNGSTDLENGEVYEVTIDRVTAQGVSTGRREVVIAQYTSATKTFDCSSADYRGIEGAAQAHPVGAVVEILVTAHYLNEHRAAFLVGHTQAGAHASALPLTSPVLTTPKVVTSINDANGNEVIKTPATTSAVNEVTVTNSATGNAVQVSATGGDTDISLNLVSKGAGTVQVNGAELVTASSTTTFTNKTLTSPVLQGTVDGWTLANETWTYASASTITVPSGAAAKYAKGDRIKFTQTTVKYGVIIAVADTLLTIAVNTDYPLANAAISANYYSHQASPVGYPDWFATAAPTWDVSQFDNASGGQPTTVLSKFKVDGDQCTHFVKATGTKAGTNAYISFVLPSGMPTVVNTNIGLGSVYCQQADQQGVIVCPSSSVFFVFTAIITDNTTIGSSVGGTYSFQY